MFSFSCRCSTAAHLFASRRGLVVGDDVLLAQLVIVDLPRPPSGCTGAISMTSSSEPSVSYPATSASRSQDAEVEARCSTSTPICRDGTRRISISMRGSRAGSLEQRQHDVDRRFVGAYEHAPRCRSRRSRTADRPLPPAASAAARSRAGRVPLRSFQRFGVSAPLAAERRPNDAEDHASDRMNWQDHP